MPSIRFNIRSKTTSSWAESLASNLQCVIADDSSCIAIDRRTEACVMILYEKNFVIAIRARVVIGPDVEEDLMTCRNGCSNEGVSNIRTSWHSFRSDLSLAKAAIRGLSCVL